MCKGGSRTAGGGLSLLSFWMIFKSTVCTDNPSAAVSPPFTQGRLKGWSLRCATSPCTGEAWRDGGFPSEGSNQRSAKKEKAPLCGDSVSNPWGIPHSGWGIVPAVILNNVQIGSLCKQSLRRHRCAWSAPPFAGGRLSSKCKPNPFYRQ